MEYIIIYFSGTGNTELISREIKKRLENAKHNVEMISIEDKDTISNMDFANKIIGFGYPVYKFTYPDIFNKTLPIINQLMQSNKYFQFSTYTRFAADALYDFSKQLDSANYTLIAQECFKAPSCGISARKPASDYEYLSVMFFEDSITKKLDAFVNKILENEVVSIEINQKNSIFDSFKKKIVESIEITKYPKLEIDNDKCIKCGLCAKNCPDKNLINEGTHIEIIDDTGCLHCLRCINHCPANAITFGKLTVGENQYTLKIRDALFEKSSSGYREEYWHDFDRIIKKWRKNTIKYWITHLYRKK